MIAVTDANGNALSTDSFAYQISLKYRGYVYDNETGLYYLQSRYYDPETGRFLNADDVGFIGYSGEQLSYNVFAYCENSVVNSSDLFGFFGAESIVGINKLIGRMAAIFSLLSILEAAIISAKTGTKLGGLKTGVIVGVAVLVVGLLVLQITNSIQVKSKNTTKILSDTKAKQPKNYPYKLAYINDRNELIKYGASLSLKQILVFLGFKTATESMYQSYTYNFSLSSDAQREVQKLGRDNNSWGVYAKTQEDAKALALILGCTDPPEVHGSGMYGHYHNSNKSDDNKHHFHIWYGNRIP